jgi:hypothetical protein
MAFWLIFRFRSTVNAGLERKKNFDQTGKIRRISTILPPISSISSAILAVTLSNHGYFFVSQDFCQKIRLSQLFTEVRLISLHSEPIRAGIWADDLPTISNGLTTYNSPCDTGFFVKYGFYQGELI